MVQGIDPGERTLEGAIDCCVHANPPLESSDDQANPLGVAPVRQTAAELITQMDSLGVQRAIIGPPAASAGFEPADGYKWVLDSVQRYPERLSLAVSVDPSGLMASARQLESMVRNDGAIAVRVAPFRTGKPLTDRVYFPLYTKCVELNIPLMSPVGLPGPRLPGMTQHPKYLDELCYLWPELKVVTTHGGEPWTRLLVQLMAKWPNLYHVLSAFSPKYFPAETVKFMNSSRGRTKVLYGTDHPFLSMSRVAEELALAEIADETMLPFLRGNAKAVFFGGVTG